MKSGEFKQFIKHVENCELNDSIWSCGWLFINLTERQGRQLYTTLQKRFEPTTLNGKCGIMLPNGLFLYNPVTNGEWWV